MSDTDVIKTKHPSYAQLSFSRTQCGGRKNLYGSSITHGNTIRLEIKESSVERNLGHEWYYGGGTIVEVEMSQSQFAEAITSLNCGSGVPVTLTFKQGVGRIENCPFVDQREKFTKDFESNTQKGMKAIDDALETVKDLFENKKAFNKADKDNVLNLLFQARRSYGDSIPFLTKSYNEALDKTENEAKGEIEAFAQTRMTSIANAAIAQNPKMLPSDYLPVMNEGNNDNTAIEDNTILNG